MSKVSFSKPGGEVETAPVTPAPEAAAQASPGVPAVYQQPGAVGPAQFLQDDDNIDIGDIVVPSMQIVQKVGDLSAIHAPGSILMNGQLVIAKPGEGQNLSAPVRLMVLGFRPKRYVEKTQGGMQGNIVSTPAEVVAAGGTTDYNEAKATGKPLYQTLAKAFVLIEQPAGLDPLSFPYEFGGKNYAIAFYNMKGTAYTSAARHFYSARKIGHLRETGYRGGWWTLQSKLEKFGTNWAYKPVVNMVEKSTPEQRAWIGNLLGC